MRHWLLLLLLLLPWAAQAQTIFRSTDAQGNVVFTDKPPAAGVAVEEIQLRQLNTAPALEVPRRPAVDPPPQPSQQRPTVSIVAPEDQSVIPMGGGDFNVQASVTPPLAPGERLQLQLDGTPSGEPQGGTSWSLRNVFRGGHNLSIQRLDADGNVIAESDPVHVQVMRPFNIQNRN